MSTAIMSNEISVKAATTDKADAAAKKKQFAIRFKTELCRSFETEHHCPYEGKCVFAHGASDLRTPEQNEADGLITDTAIRGWLRRQKQQREQQQPPVKQGNEWSELQVQRDDSFASSRSEGALSEPAATPVPSDGRSSPVSSAATTPRAVSVPAAPRRVGYHHNPYSPSGMTVVYVRPTA